MKKTLLLLVLIFLLSSCFGDSDEVKKAKQDLGVIEGETNNIDENKGEGIIKNVGDFIDDSPTDPRIQITQISGQKMLELGELTYSEFKNGYSKITGTTLGDVDSIDVEFSNAESEYPDDSFTLSKFKAGDKIFEYNASSKFKVLDFGTNVYTFTANSGDKKSVLELQVLVSENDDKLLRAGSIETLDSEIKDDSEGEDNNDDNVEFTFSDLPKGGDYGDILKIGEESFTYSDIKGLEIREEKIGVVNCGKDEATDSYYVSDFLGERQKSWYYWNTCRDIIKGKGISFFVVRLDGDNYVYEKHYLDTAHGLYGTYELEIGEGVDKDSISDKNKELKEKNEDFTQLEVVDSLFRDIVE